jgi:uncharacterized protein
VSATSNQIAARIVLRPVGIPLPLGISGLAIASFVNSGLELHWIKASQTLEVGVILAAVPFTLQLVASVFSYLARDAAVGATLGVLAATWLALGLLHVVSPATQASGATGLLLLVAGGLVALSALAVGVVKPLPAVVFLAAALRFELAGIYQLSASKSWEDASGILGLVITGLAAYCTLAFELERLSRAPRLPTFRLSGDDVAVNDGAGLSLDQIEREPGVRPAT